MQTVVSRFPRHVLVGISCMLMILLLGGCLAFSRLPRLAPRIFASALLSLAPTCAQSPTPEHCNNQDPEQEGCAADARTLDQAAIVENGVPIGRVERRYSPTCRSWWGRVFDDRKDSQADMFITIAGQTISATPQFVGSQYRILYSPMVFDAALPLVPAITGALNIDGIIQAPDATLPAIPIPHPLKA